jgi:hypothetical protein
MHFHNVNDKALAISGWQYGVVDHCLFDQASFTVNNAIGVQHNGWNGDNGGYGDASYADSSYLGTNQFIFIETNTFNQSSVSGTTNDPNGFTNDSQLGGRFVFRYNTVNRMLTQSHGTQDRRRGTRAYEVYNNTFNWQCSPNCSSDQGTYAFYARSGTGVVWGNTSTGYVTLVNAHNDRSETVFEFPMWATAGSTPNGYCNGSDLWDENSNATGNACLDQVGRGAGQLITGTTPVSSATGTATWPHQALEPVYEWLDNYNAPPDNGYDQLWASGTGAISVNRDYYLYTNTFNGSSGVGSGQLSARPSTCTAMTAYWATDTNTLYQCTTTNRWAAYYTPFTYPHPLTLGSGTAPAPPTGLSAVVQ